MTAEEQLLIVAKNHGMNKLVTGHSVSLFKEAMIEFAKYHVQEAQASAVFAYANNPDDPNISDSYPLENIK